MKEFYTTPMAIDNLVLKLAHVSAMAAIASHSWVGRGRKIDADFAAVEAMRKALEKMPISGTVVIGEGEMDKAPMLYIGEKVGAGGAEMDIAVDPLEGTNMTANNLRDAVTVIAMGHKGNLLNAPDIYMDKIAIGPNLPSGVVDLDNPIEKNIYSLAETMGKEPSEVTIVMLDRPRHEEIITRARQVGARVSLLPDGDVSAAISTCWEGVDLFVGSGGAPEGVLAAAALRCMGGQMQGRLLFENDAQRQRSNRMLGGDPGRKLELHDMAAGDVIFSVSGVTDGSLVKGVRYDKRYNRIITHSLVMESQHGKIQFLETHHPYNVTQHLGKKE